MNGDNPATKQDLKDLDASLRGEITELRGEVKQLATELRGEMKASEDRLIETLRDVQTELLKAFYSYATSADAKLKESEIADITLRQRLTAVESRLTEVEKKLHLPPAA
jgi:hypothetical protein